MNSTKKKAKPPTIDIKKIDTIYNRVNTILAYLAESSNLTRNPPREGISSYEIRAKQEADLIELTGIYKGAQIKSELLKAELLELIGKDPESIKKLTASTMQSLTGFQKAPIIIEGGVAQNDKI